MSSKSKKDEMKKSSLKALPQSGELSNNAKLPSVDEL